MADVILHANALRLVWLILKWAFFLWCNWSPDGSAVEYDWDRLDLFLLCILDFSQRLPGIHNSTFLRWLPLKSTSSSILIWVSSHVTINYGRVLERERLRAWTLLILYAASVRGINRRPPRQSLYSISGSHSRSPGIKQNLSSNAPMSHD